MGDGTNKYDVMKHKNVTVPTQEKVNANSAFALFVAVCMIDSGTERVKLVMWRFFFPQKLPGTEKKHIYIFAKFFFFRSACDAEFIS